MYSGKEGKTGPAPLLVVGHLVSFGLVVGFSFCGILHIPHQLGIAHIVY